MSGYLKLRDVGAQTTGGKHMAGHGDTGFGESKRNQANFDDSFAVVQGMGGNRLREVGAGLTTSIAYAAKDMFDQSARAVKGEGLSVEQDMQSYEGQGTALSDGQATTSMLRTNIEA